MWDFALFPDQSSELARQVDHLYLFDLRVASFFTIVIFVMIVSFAVRYRGGSRASRTNPLLASPLMEAF
jgi:hypothetical protein